jgi:hypothetical protein
MFSRSATNRGSETLRSLRLGSNSKGNFRVVGTEPPTKPSAAF